MQLLKNLNYSWKFVYRLSVTGIIILICFSLGSRFYFYFNGNKPQKILVKNFQSNIALATAKNFELLGDGQKLTINPKISKTWTIEYIRTYSGQKDVKLVPDKIQDFLVGQRDKLSMEPVNAKLDIKDGEVQAFTPEVPGKRLNLDLTTKNIMTSFKDGRSSASLAFDSVEPAITLARANNLGINTLLGRGESNFTGSSDNRIYNIIIGSGKMNGIIVKPGEEFSFNKHLGNVSEAEGYRAELVIKKGLLVPEAGGGLCQVSTTLFRSAVYAGLPITQRKPHQFPVHYYNPQGFDATIYPGIVDLKFVNNTPAYILIQSRIIGKKLFFDIYGSSDGRKVTVDGPYQYDQKPNGSMKAYFTRKIETEDGNMSEEKFESIYNPPPPREKNPLE